jgi:rhamnosyltransferase
MNPGEIPKCAVLLAAYNGIKWIDKQVDTLQNQNGVDVHLFVSVDLSNDGTTEWVRSL